MVALHSRHSATRAERAATVFRQHKLRTWAFAAWRTALIDAAADLCAAAEHAATSAVRFAFGAWRAGASASAAASAQIVRAAQASAGRATAAATLSVWRRVVLEQRRLLYCFLLAQHAASRTRVKRALSAWRAWMRERQRKRAAVSRALLHRSLRVCSAALAALSAYALRRRRHRAAVTACMQCRARRWLHAWRRWAAARAALRRLGTACVLRVRSAAMQRCVRVWRGVVLRKRRERIVLAMAACLRRERTLHSAWRHWARATAASALLRRVFSRAEAAWLAWRQERARLDFELLSSTFTAWALEQRTAATVRAETRTVAAADTFRRTCLRVAAFHAWRAAAAAAAAATAAEWLQRAALCAWAAAAAERGRLAGSRTAARTKLRAAGFSSEVDVARRLRLRRTLRRWQAASGVASLRSAATARRKSVLRRVWQAWWTQASAAMRQKCVLEQSRLRCTWQAWRQHARHRSRSKVWFLPTPFASHDSNSRTLCCCAPKARADAHRSTALAN